MNKMDATSAHRQNKEQIQKIRKMNAATSICDTKILEIGKLSFPAEKVTIPAASGKLRLAKTRSVSPEHKLSKKLDDAQQKGGEGFEIKTVKIESPSQSSQPQEQNEPNIIEEETSEASSSEYNDYDCRQMKFLGSSTVGID